MTTAILIHGCHVEADKWEEIVWGKPQIGVLGRAARAFQLLKSEKAEVLFWGSGASERDGLKESEYTLKYSLSHLEELATYQSKNIDKEREYLISISEIDTQSQNTAQEIENATRMCIERGISRIILVSSPTHISRCLLEAEKIRSAKDLKGLEIFATASDTCYGGSTPADVLVVEPPHRGDRSQIKIHEILRPIMKRLRDRETGVEFANRLQHFMREML